MRSTLPTVFTAVYLMLVVLGLVLSPGTMVELGMANPVDQGDQLFTLGVLPIPVGMTFRSIMCILGVALAVYAVGYVLAHIQRHESFVDMPSSEAARFMAKEQRALGQSSQQYGMGGYGGMGGMGGGMGGYGAADPYADPYGGDPYGGSPGPGTPGGFPA